MAKYMHTIDGKPACFDGDQLVFASKKHPIRLADSLKQIRREQKKSRDYRESWAWMSFDYDYVLVKETP